MRLNNLIPIKTLGYQSVKKKKKRMYTPTLIGTNT